MKEFTVVFPTYHCKDYATILIKSFEKFKPTELNISYVVVENSDDDSYKDHILSLADSIIWIQNKIDLSSHPHNVRPSFANAKGVIKGLEKVVSEWTFVAHSDVCVTSESFFTELIKKVDEGYELIGTVKDNIRMHAIHVSGYLTKTDYLRKVDISPNVEWKGIGDAAIIYDVGDSVDLFCRLNNIKTFCFENTENDSALRPLSPYDKFHVDRCLDKEGKTIFMHLGRGADKEAGVYKKPNRILKDDWVKFCYKLIGE